MLPNFPDFVKAIEGKPGLPQSQALEKFRASVSVCLL